MADEYQTGPLPNPSPIANPSQGGFGDVLRYLLPIIGGVASAAYPGMARGVGAATGIMGMQQDIADRQFELSQKKRLQDLQYQGLQSATDSINKRMQRLATPAPDPTGGASANIDPSPRNDTGAIVPSANPYNAGGTGKPAGQTSGLANQVDGMSQSNIPPLARSALENGMLAIRAGNLPEAIKWMEQHDAIMARSPGSELGKTPAPRGVTLKGTTREGASYEKQGAPETFKTPEEALTSTAATPEERANAQTLVDTKVEKTPFKAMLDAAGTPQEKAAIAQRAFQAQYNKTPLEVLNDPNASPEQKANAKWVVQQGQARVNIRTQDARSDRSYALSTKQLDTLAGPIDQRVQRLSTLLDTVHQKTPQADALIAPELLTVMAGGQGSGLRMNEAEIARIVGGRTNWESLKAAANKWQLNPAKGLSITPAQRSQVEALVQTVNTRLLQKKKALDGAYAQLLDAQDPADHRRIVNEARKAVSGVDVGAANPLVPGGQSDVTAPAPPQPGGSADDRLKAKLGLK